VCAAEQQCSCGPGLWSREISIAACNYSSGTNANDKDSDYCRTAAWCSSFGRTKAAKPSKEDAKIKAERRVGSLGGMRQEPTRVQTGRGELTKPARNFSTLLSLFSIRWRPVFPPGPLPETSRGLRCCQNLVVITKVADAVERGVRKRGFEVRSSALTISLQRNQPLCCTRCNQTQRARGQA